MPGNEFNSGIGEVDGMKGRFSGREVGLRQFFLRWKSRGVGARSVSPIGGLRGFDGPARYPGTRPERGVREPQLADELRLGLWQPPSWRSHNRERGMSTFVGPGSAHPRPPPCCLVDRKSKRM